MCNCPDTTNLQYKLQYKSTLLEYIDVYITIQNEKKKTKKNPQYIQE